MRRDEMDFVAQQVALQLFWIDMQRLRFEPGGKLANAASIGAHGDAIAGGAQFFAGRDEKIDIVAIAEVTGVKSRAGLNRKFLCKIKRRPISNDEGVV